MELTYRPDIDGLRAVAVLSVIIFHAFPALLQGGFVGVDIFFVISGYLISGIILKKLVQESFSFRDFYGRRIRRIFPALILVLATCLLFGWFFLFGNEYASLGKDTASAAGFIPNILYWKEAGYFDVSSILKPLLHLWSLGVEEQFYLLWPLLLLLLYTLKSRKRIFFSIACLFILSFASNFLPFINSSAAFYLPYTRFWELLVGAMLALSAIHNDQFFNSKKKIVQREIISAMGLILVAVGIYLIQSSTFNALWALLPTIGAACIIISGGHTWINRSILSHPLLVNIGLISYPLYLWHWPLLSFANIIQSGFVSVQLRLILVATSFLLAWLTYIFIEKPLRFHKKNYTTLSLILFLIVIGGAGFVIYVHNGFSSRFPQQEAMLQSLEKGPRTDAQCEEMYGKNIGNNYCLTAGTGNKKVFIIGDSHTQAIFTGYSQSLVNQGYTVTELGNSACSFVLPVNAISSSSFSNDDKQQMLRCNAVLGEIFSVTLSTHPYAIILANNGWQDKQSLFEIGMNKTLSLISSTVKVVWFLQNPQPPDHYYTACLKNALCSFPFSDVEKQRVGYAAALSHILQKHPTVRTVDPSTVLCSVTVCPETFNNKFLYDETTHLSLAGSEYAADKLPIVSYFPTYAFNPSQ